MVVEWIFLDMASEWSVVELKEMVLIQVLDYIWMVNYILISINMKVMELVFQTQQSLIIRQQELKATRLIEIIREFYQ